MSKYEPDEFGFYNETSPWTALKYIGAAVGIAALGVFILTGNAGASTLKEVVNSTARLYDGARFICSANFIGSSEKGRDYFVTAAHCVNPVTENEGANLTLRWQEFDADFKPTVERSFNVDTVRRFEEDDTAVIETRVPVDHMMTPIDIATEAQFTQVEIGEKVMAVGYPKGLEISVTFGTFTGEVQSLINPKGRMWRADPGVTGGSSGGGFYIERSPGDYALVGVTSAGWRDAQFMNYFATPTALARVVKSYVEDTPTNETTKAHASEMEEMLSDIAKDRMIGR